MMINLGCQPNWNLKVLVLDVCFQGAWACVRGLSWEELHSTEVGTMQLAVRADRTKEQKNQGSTLPPFPELEHPPSMVFGIRPTLQTENYITSLALDLLALA